MSAAIAATTTTTTIAIAWHVITQTWMLLLFNIIIVRVYQHSLGRIIRGSQLNVRKLFAELLLLLFSGSSNSSILPGAIIRRCFMGATPLQLVAQLAMQADSLRNTRIKFRLLVGCVRVCGFENGTNTCVRDEIWLAFLQYIPNSKPTAHSSSQQQRKQQSIILHKTMQNKMQSIEHILQLLILAHAYKS